MKGLERETAFATPGWLGIDESHVLKRPRCVLINVEMRTIIDLLPDRSKATAAQRLFAFRDKDLIRYAAMDMWTPYRDAVRAILPKATIVVEKVHSLIRCVDRAGRGYSFEALRAKMLYPEGLHKVERSKVERRAAGGFSELLLHRDDSIGMMLPEEVYGEPTNYGTELSTLARRMDAGSF